MKKTLIIIIASLFLNLTAKGQNLFLIGEKSYPCTNAITLVSNSNDHYDLDVFLGKDGKSGVFAISRRSIMREMIVGKLIIYLEDGNVITCNESEVTENVDENAKALYILMADQLVKLKASNIHTVKYTTTYYGGQNFSASNKGIKTKNLISEFFNE